MVSRGEGKVAHLLLHIDWKTGLLDALERYKETPEDVLDLAPPLEGVRVQRFVPPPASFTFESGWVTHDASQR
jgi:hypothetical protein